MSFWNGRKVFVTGATGIVGSSLVEMLLANKAEVTILLRDDVYNSQLVSGGFINKVNVVNGELEDLELVSRTINEYEIQTIFHLAAQTIVGTANRSPIPTFKSNIMGTWNVLEGARNSSLVSSVVVASSDKAYGDQKELPYTESAPLQGKHPYDVSKSCADLISQTYAVSYNLPVVIARCANIFGPGDLNFNRIVPETIKSASEGKSLVIRSDGKFIRDYIFVKDVANAYMLLAEKLEELDIKGEGFNFSAGNKLTVIELVEKIHDLMNNNIEPKIMNQAKNEIKDQYLDASKAEKILGWKSQFELDDSLKETIKWYEDFFKDTK